MVKLVELQIYLNIIIREAVDGKTPVDIMGYQILGEALKFLTKHVTIAKAMKKGKVLINFFVISPPPQKPKQNQSCSTRSGRNIKFNGLLIPGPPNFSKFVEPTKANYPWFLKHTPDNSFKNENPYDKHKETVDICNNIQNGTSKRMGR